ncbi:MAG: SBBP repeat-containing protein [Chlorobi bacterium]|nr:SBBP repeat-containing protein [Chlorobiota bacterium]MCI0717268.1 SBBP repeat-containing protein [Chlorobiota bacterium]
MKTIFSILSLLLISAQSFSFGEEWVARFNGAGNTSDWAYGITLDPSGNAYVTGYSTGAGTGKDYMTIKYNSNGSVLWTSSYNGPINGGDYSNAIAVDQSGNAYVTGRADFGTSFADIVTIKYNSQGVQQWSARYNGPANNMDEARCIKVDATGNVYIAGYSFNTNKDFIVIKYNSNGTESWVATYNGPGNNEDVVNSLDVDNGGNVYIAGNSIGAGTGSDFTVIKYNSNGTEAWVKRYNGPGNGGDAALSVRVDGLGNVYTAGYADYGSNNGYDFITIKYNSAGSQLWLAQYDGANTINDFCTAMTIDAGGNVYVTGSSATFIGQLIDSNYATIKYNTNGQQQWVALYNGPNNSIDVSRSISVDNLGNTYITGTSRGANSDDYVTIKYAPNGSSLWVMAYNGPANGSDLSVSVVVDNNENAYVTGRSLGSGSDFDYATIKYSSLVGINIISTEIPSRFNLYQNYPNPFNPITKIKFDLPKAYSNVVLRIYNSLGVLAGDYNLGNLSPASYEYTLNLNSFSSGVYLYQLITNETSQTKKMVLVK